MKALKAISLVLTGAALAANFAVAIVDGKVREMEIAEQVKKAVEGLK